MAKTFADAILAAEKISTKKEKHEALSGMDADGVRLLLEAEDPFRVFGIKKWDKPKAYASFDPSFSKFFVLLDLLANRHLTGNAAKDAVTSVLGQYTERTASVLERVLKKDLKCGASSSTFEAVYPSLKVPHFDKMLCGKIEFKKENGKIVYPKYNWTFPCLAEVKYDGMRLFAFVENGNVTYFSRSGKPADEWNGLFDADLVAMEKVVGQPIVVDGEALGEDFQATAKAKGSKNDKSGMKFFVFDLMTVAQWKAESCPVKQIDRTVFLEQLLATLKPKTLVKSKAKILSNMEQALAFYEEVTELGLPGQDEGLIIKKLDGLYEWNEKKRTLTWAKWKPVIDVDVKITGVYEGQKGTKNEGRLGGFYVAGEDENGNKIESKCGGFKVNDKKFQAWIAKFAKQHGIDLDAIYATGVSKDEFFRTFAFKNPQLFIGQTAMIECQSLSKAQNSDTFALRFPQFIQVRTDK